jgi:hypothetical protein
MKIPALPPIQPEPHLVYVLKRNKHVTLALAHQQTGAAAFAVTLHAVEARLLGKALIAIADGEEEGATFVEGACLGGPPSRDEVLDPP